GYEAAMEAQRDKGRAQSAFGGRKGEDFEAPGASLQQIGDRFEGYTTTRVAEVPVVALFDERRQTTSALQAGQSGYVALERTPFYLEAGGQVSDRSEERRVGKGGR